MSAIVLQYSKIDNPINATITELFADIQQHAPAHHVALAQADIVCAVCDRAGYIATNCRTKALLFKNGRINPAVFDALRQLGNDDRRSQRDRGRCYEARDRRQQRAIANHVQGAVASELASLFPDTVVSANVSSSSDSQYHHLPSPRDVPLIIETGASTTMMPHTRFHRTVWNTTNAVTMANGDSTRAIDVGEAMFPVVGHGIALQSLIVPGLCAGLIAAGQVATWPNSMTSQSKNGPCSSSPAAHHPPQN
jgi:hypothetical protein